MTRQIFLWSTLLFWLSISTIGFVATRTGPAPSVPIAASPAEPPAIAPDTAAPNAAPPPVPTKVLTLADVSRHATADDCWMAIRGSVYDLDAYLPEHPTRPQIVIPWCGREATEAYNTKMRGRAHSARADALLEQYRIGALGDPH